ncbi:MAG: lytic transglycosylase domain-containing protein [Gammaproteobacteria bacterium]|nr:lytic transglycosylase domain-containing protein [Gammaproteobacteria bacterium]
MSPKIQQAHSAVAISIVPPAYRWAARAAHVPASILFAVAREESGMPIRGRWIPWPWTLNVAGAPHRFASQAEACAALGRALRKSPSGPIDVGLGQIDLGYYGDRVATPCDLLNPYLNLLLAARILRGFHHVDEGWMTAVGRYHRPAGGAPAEKYRREVAQQLAQVLKYADETTLPEATLP